jgi:hypothetical protein
MVADMKTMIDLPGMTRNLSLSNCFYQNWTIIFREVLLHQKQDQKSSYQKQVVSAPQLASSMINVRGNWCPSQLTVPATVHNILLLLLSPTPEAGLPTPLLPITS